MLIFALNTLAFEAMATIALACAYVIPTAINLSVFPLDWIARKCRPNTHGTSYTKKSNSFRENGMAAVLPVVNIVFAVKETPVLWFYFAKHMLFGC